MRTNTAAWLWHILLCCNLVFAYLIFPEPIQTLVCLIFAGAGWMAGSSIPADAPPPETPPPPGRQIHHGRAANDGR